MRRMHRWSLTVAAAGGLIVALVTLPVDDWILGLVGWVRAGGSQDVRSAQ